MNNNLVKTKDTDKNHFKLYLLLSFVIPFVILLLAYTVDNIGFLGDKSVLIGDLRDQYVNFYSQYQTILKTGDFSKLLYSWNLGFGGNFLGLFSYYLASPVSLLVLLFPKDQLAAAMEVMILVKVSLASLTFFIYIKYVYKKVSIISVLFSTMYGLMSYAIVFSLNIMWLDGIIFLPLILIGVRRLIFKNKIGLFALFLAIMFIDNYYIAYPVGIFTFLYFTATYFTENSIKNIKGYLKKFFIFMIGVIIAATCAAVIILPTYFSLKNGGAATLDSQLLVSSTFGSTIEKFFMGTFNAVSYGSPNIYCGLLPLLLIVPYFFNKKTKAKEKIIDFIFILVLLVSFASPFLTWAWQDFNVPIWYMFRYSFVFSFLVLIIAYKTIENLDYTPILGIVASVIFLGAGIYYILAYGVGESIYKTVSPSLVDHIIVKPVNHLLLEANMVLIVIYAILILMLRLKLKRKKIIISIIFVLVCGEMLFASATYLNDMYSQIGYLSKGIFNEVLEIEPDVKAVQSTDTSFYRMEQLNTIERFNEGIALSYNSISTFTSMAYRSMDDFLTNTFGIQDGGTGISLSLQYKSTTEILDSLFDIKYILSKEPLGGFYTNNIEGVNRYINENKYALPIGYVVSDYALSKDIKYTVGSYFENTNIFLNSFLGYGQNDSGYTRYLAPISYSTTLQNISVLDESPGYAKLEVTNPYYDGVINLNFTSDSNQEVYLNLNNGNSNESTIYVNGKEVGLYSAYDEPKIINLGYFTKGESATISVKLDTEISDLGTVELYGLNENEFSQAYETLDSQSMKDIKVTNTSISGTVDGSGTNDVLFLSVPYDKGWHAYIDGKEVSIESVDNSFMAIKLKQGEQTVVLKFTPEGFNLGLVMTILSSIVLIYVFMKEKQY